MEEIRSYGNVTRNDKIIEGYASLFNSRSVDLGGFTEEIAEGAFDGVIDRSTVLAVINHNTDRGILAKCKNGKGSLNLEVDDRGLKFSFKCPNTQLGNELLEMLERGDISATSIKFTVLEDKWKKEEGKYVRTITKIGNLYDISPVYDPAYPDTSVAVAQRSLEAFKAELEEAEKRAKEEEEKVEEVEEEKEVEETETETETEEVKEEEIKQEDINKEEEQEKKSCKTNIRNHNNITMGKFSLVKTIRSIVNNQPIDELNQMVLNEGKEEMRKSGLSYAGQIQLPIEQRDEAGATTTTPDAVVAGVEDYGKEIVATEKLNILAPLKNKLVFTELGANYITGLVGNVSIPSYSGSTAGWAGEIEEASDGKGTFDTVEYSPKRITAYIDISKQFINQDSVGAEELLRADIIDAVSQVLEATILGTADATTKKPAGIFYGADNKTLTYAGLVDMEKDLEEANVSGDFKFVVSPAIKATMKTTAVGGTKSDFRMLLEGGEANGYPVISTGNCSGIALANWNDLLICQFGALDVTVDPYTVATKGCIRLVVNAYFDAKFRRSESVVALV